LQSRERAGDFFFAHLAENFFELGLGFFEFFLRFPLVFYGFLPLGLFELLLLGLLNPFAGRVLRLLILLLLVLFLVVPPLLAFLGLTIFGLAALGFGLAGFSVFPFLGLAFFALAGIRGLPLL